MASGYFNVSKAPLQPVTGVLQCRIEHTYHDIRHRIEEIWISGRRLTNPGRIKTGFAQDIEERP